MARLIGIALLLSGGLALGQANPDDEWGNFPPDAVKPPPTPPPVAPPAPLVPLLPAPQPAPALKPQARVGVIVPKAPEEPNTISLYGAPTLGQWRRAEAVSLGFPLLGVKAGIGLLDRLDVVLGFQSFYGVMNEFQAGFKVGLYKGSNWTISAVADGYWALFTLRAAKEVRGPRWITGHRNFGLSPGVLLSYQGDSARSARLFLHARYLMTFDTEPFAATPLNGVPPGLQLGHNGELLFGAEMPLSARTSFVFVLGMDFHGRPDDAPVMPTASIGLVTSF